MASEQIDAFVIRYKEEMMKADVNGDGKISFAEFMDKVQKEMDDLKTASGIWKLKEDFNQVIIIFLLTYKTILYSFSYFYPFFP